MSKTCAVCKKGKGPEVCEVCGFTYGGEINKEWPITEDAERWFETVVKPYRVLWEAKKLETKRLMQILTQIKELKLEVKRKETESAKLAEKVKEHKEEVNLTQIDELRLEVKRRETESAKLAKKVEEYKEEVSKLRQVQNAMEKRKGLLKEFVLLAILSGVSGVSIGLLLFRLYNYPEWLWYVFLVLIGELLFVQWATIIVTTLDRTPTILRYVFCCGITILSFFASKPSLGVYIAVTNNINGIEYAKKNNYDDAIVKFTIAIERNPKFARAYYNRGIAYLQKGNIIMANADFARARELGHKPRKLKGNKQNVKIY